MSERGNLTITGHLVEFRQRLIKCLIALAITTLISLIFARQIFNVLIYPSEEINLIYIEMTEMIGTYMRVGLVSGIVLAMPFLIYQLFMFVSPALTTKEKKTIYLMLPWIMFMFAAGIAFCYFILLPPAIEFLTTFGSEIAEPQIKIGNYISIVTGLLLSIGVVFETPVIILFLARLGVVTPRWLSSKRKYAIIIAFILAAVITPTFDPVNQSLVAAPIIILYEMSIWLSRMAYKKRTEVVPQETAMD